MSLSEHYATTFISLWIREAAGGVWGRGGWGVLDFKKRLLKGCGPPRFAFEIIPSLIFISAEHVKLVSLGSVSEGNKLEK